MGLFSFLHHHQRTPRPVLTSSWSPRRLLLRGEQDSNQDSAEAYKTAGFTLVSPHLRPDQAGAEPVQGRGEEGYDRRPG